MVLDEEGNVIDERPVGSAADLPAAEGYEVTTDEQGNKTTTVTDESGSLLKLQLGPEGSVLNLELPPSTRLPRPPRTQATSPNPVRSKARKTRALWAR